MTTKRYRWTVQKLELMNKLRDQGLNWEQIAIELRNTFNDPINAKIVSNRYSYRYVARPKEPKDSKHPRSKPENEIAGYRFCPKIASLQHLLDLKRAGHSPKDTELNIAGPFRPVRFKFVPYLSTYRSPAAMCTDHLAV
jgi:hypothetical protein